MLLDYAMPDGNSDDVAATIKRIKPDVCILLFSGAPHEPENSANVANMFGSFRATEQLTTP